MSSFIRCIGILIVIAVAAIIGLFSFGVYLPWQTVNGNNVGLKTREDVAADILSEQPTCVVATINGKDVEFTEAVDHSDVSAQLQQGFLDWLCGEDITVESVSTINYNTLVSCLQEYIEPMADASIECTEGRWILHREIEGYVFDPVGAADSVEDYYVNVDSFRQMPKVTADSLEKDFSNVSWLNDFEITYTNGAHIRGVDLSEYVTDYTLEVPDELLKEVVSKLVEFYSTNVGELRFYEPVSNNTLSVPKKTFGKKVEAQKEIDYIRDLIDKHENEYNRTPIMSGYDKFDGTYVVVSIEQQHLWYYKDGELVDETDVVTGRKGVHDTPTGAYYISECIPGKYLVGDTYKTWVNQWMRLTNSGIGLHDAYWRGQFGGTVYVGNGSHGCINIPKDFALYLYKESYVGMPVIIY